MNLEAQVRYLQIYRGHDGLPRASELDPQALRATDAVAAELGFERGELLGFVDRIVFVEGVTDREFLEATAPS